MDAQSSKNSNFQSWKVNSKTLCFFIAIAIGLALWFGLQPVNGLTPSGVRAIAVIVPILFMWLTVNTHWSCLLLFALLILAEVMTPSAVWAGSMGHFAPTLLLVFVLITQCLSDTGAVDKIAAWFITRKFVQGKPYLFLAMLFFSNIFIGFFMQNLALTIIYIDLVARICEKIGVKKGHSLYIGMMLGTIWVDSVVSIASPIAKTLPNIMIGSLYTQFGITITYAQWLAIGVPYAIVSLAVIMICIRIFKPDVSKLKDLDVEEFSKTIPPITARGKVALITLAVLILAILLPDMLVMMGIFVPVASYFVRVGATVPAILAVVFLCQFKVQGEPVMDFAQTAKKVPMTLIVFIAAVVVVGVPISYEGNGIIVWIGNNLQPLVAALSPVQIIIALVFCALLVTNFISSAVTMVLFFNIGAALLIGTGVHIGAFGILMGLISAMACLTPSASLTCPLFFGPEHITVANSYKINLVNMAFCFVVLMIFIPFVLSVIT